MNEKFTLYDVSKYENHTTNELPLNNPVYEDIEKAAKSYAFTYSGEDEVLKYEAFKAGAEWQKEKDIRDMLMSDCRNFEKCYELGKKDMKEQIMKDAIIANIGYYNQHGLSIYPEKSIEKLGFDEHDNVKIVIIREE